MKVGILFGGPSRERDRSLPNARTIYALLDKALFEAVLLFTDASGRLYQMEPAALEYRSVQELLDTSEHQPGAFSRTQENLGERDGQMPLRHLIRQLQWKALPGLIDFAWNAMHGTFAEDGQLQEKLEALGIPYSGCAAKTCRYLADRTRLRELLDLHDFTTTPAIRIGKAAWATAHPASLHKETETALQFPIRMRPGDIPGSGGHTQIDEPEDLERFELAVNRAFFQEVIPVAEWRDRTPYERQETIRLLGDLEDGLGFPIEVQSGKGYTALKSPDEMLDYFNRAADQEDINSFRLRSQLEQPQEVVLIETVPEGVPFSCIVVAIPQAGLLALPPQVPDEYDSARFPSHISQLATEAFQRLQLSAFAQISGYSLPDGRLLIDDIKSQPDFQPGSALWSGFGKLGLSPSQALTALILASLDKTPSLSGNLGEELESKRKAAKGQDEKGIAILSGGFGYGGRLSLASAREVFQWLDGMEGYRPIPIWATLTEKGPQYFRLPPDLFLTASMPELHHWCANPPAPAPYEDALAELERQYSSRAYPKVPELCPVESWPAMVRYAWVFLQEYHEPGHALYKTLQQLGLPHSSASEKAVRLCSNKQELLSTLARNGISVPRQLKLSKEEYQQDKDAALNRLESQIGYPMIARPLHGHYSAGVQYLNARLELEAYTRLLYRPESETGLEARRALGLSPGMIFPQQAAMVVAPQATRKAGYILMEISAHVYTRKEEPNARTYHWLPISEIKPAGHIVRPIEKYEQAAKYSYTPARFASDEAVRWSIQQQLEKAIRLLDLKNPTNIDAFVHLQEGKAPEVTIFDINLQPPMASGALLGVQLAAAGQTPQALLKTTIENALQSSDNRKIPAQAVSPAQPIYNTTTMNEDTTPVSPEPSKSTGRTNHREGSFTEQVKARVKVYAAETWLFLKSPVFLRNFGGILLMVFGSVFITRWALKIYTRHGESIQVPDYVGMDMRDAVRKAKRQNFKVVAIDSFFDSTKRPNTIYQQEPAPNQRAKEGRTIYVSKYRAQADSVLLPTLMQASYNFDQYQSKLKRMDITSRIKERVFDNKQEENTVLYFFHNGRKVTDDMLRRGMKVPRGSTLEFVITERITNKVALPDLICKRFDEAKFLLTTSNLALGQTFGAEGLEKGAFVYQQEPEYVPGQMVVKGTSINLYLTNTRPEGCPEPIDVPQEDEGF